MWHISTLLTNFVIHINQPLERWKTTITIMLDNVKGSSEINRLRVIERYEADYSLLLKLYQTKLITQHAQREATLRKSQLGTRPHTILNDTSLLNELILDICCIQKCIFIMKQNGASVCYDRILANYSSINSQRKVTPNNYTDWESTYWILPNITYTHH